MPKIKDRALIKWLDNGVETTEELVFYESADSSEHACESDQSSEYFAADLTEVSKDDFMRQIVVQCVLDALEKFSVLKCIAQGKFKIINIKFPQYKTIEERFGDKIQYGEEFYSESKKRFLDLVLIYSVLYRTLEDLTNKGTFTSLLEAVKIVKRLLEEETQLFYNAEHSSTLLRELEVKLVTQAKALEAQYKLKLEDLHKLEQTFEDLLAYGVLQTKYTTLWEEARRYQGSIVLNAIEEGYFDTINTSKLKIQQEERIHCDIVRFFETNMQDMHNEIQYWMEQYDVEIDSRDAEILKMKMERDALIEKLLHLRTVYQVHAEFVEEWGALREERRIAAELLERETKAAIKIQRWWRYMLFRHKLGPYRKKRKGKGKGKDKGKGKGKKK